MDKKQRFFIYDRKEMMVLILLAILVALFAFTLGVHLGKRVGDDQAVAPLQDASPVETVDDSVPGLQELTEQGKQAAEVSDEVLNQLAHDEVSRQGMKLDVPRQVDLPKDTRSPKKGATSSLHPLPSGKTAEAKYTIQVGSFPTLDEANRKASVLKKKGVIPMVHPADVPGKGRWYRVYLGEYLTRESAQDQGQELLKKKWIQSYIISNWPVE